MILKGKCMKKIITLVVCTILSMSSYSSNYAMIDDAPDYSSIPSFASTKVLLEDAGALAGRCIGFVKNKIFRLTPLISCKKMLVGVVFVLVLATLVGQVSGDITEVIPDFHSLLKAMQEECASILNLDTINPTEHQLAQTLYQEMSNIFEGCSSQRYLPSDPLFWENARFCAVTLSEKVAAEECRGTGILTQFCTDLFEFVLQKNIDIGLSVLKQCSQILLNHNEILSEFEQLQHTNASGAYF